MATDSGRHAQDEEIRSLVARLGRPHRSGGTVIERAAIIAAGADSQAVMAWIAAHGGTPEVVAAGPTRRGLHGSLLHAEGADHGLPTRFVVPGGALD
jgi:hypothetical protein